MKMTGVASLFTSPSDRIRPHRARRQFASRWLNIERLEDRLAMASAGSPIMEFGNHGTKTLIPTNVNPSDSYVDGNTVVVAGNTIQTPASAFISRFQLDGSLDASFGTNGMTISPMGSTDVSASKVIKLSNGQWLLGGTASQNTPVLFRYQSNGGLDTTFGSNGISLSTRSITRKSSTIWLSMALERSTC